MTDERPTMAAVLEEADAPSDHVQIKGATSEHIDNYHCTLAESLIEIWVPESKRTPERTEAIIEHANERARRLLRHTVPILTEPADPLQQWCVMIEMCEFFLGNLLASMPDSARMDACEVLFKTAMTTANRIGGSMGTTYAADMAAKADN